MFISHLVNKSRDVFAHNEVVTTLACGHLLGRVTEPRGMVTYSLNIGEGLVQGYGWGDLVKALEGSGCPCAHDCLMEGDYELDFLSNAAVFTNH